MKLNKAILVASALLMLEGCANSNVRGDWDCPYQEGLGCATISEADRGVKNTPIHQRADPQSEHSETSRGAQILNTYPYPVKIIPGQPVRIDPTKGRMWFAPFTDKHDFWHDQSYVHFVEEDGQWMTGE
ncbi:MAG: TraV family lipoprotein [Gammaproteobacteria bacterium]|nr:TraV family lipoprotein [Gammaproteobacteria bacterium]